MTEFLQNFDFASMSSYRLPLHILTLVFVAWNVLKADHMAFSWMRGEPPLLDPEIVRKYHLRVSVGLTLMILTGLTLFWPIHDYLLERRQFYVKMAFVLGLVVNSFVVTRYLDLPTTRTFSSLSFKEKLPLFISGVVSTFSWLGAAVGAFYIVAG